MRGRYAVYIVRCADGTYYTGCTNDLDKRLRLHNAGRGAKYLRGRQPVRLVYAKACRGAAQALRAEYQVKRLTREQKAALIRRKTPSILTAARCPARGRSPARGR